MIIDAHNHPDWHGHDLTRFLQNMDQYHIDRTWLLSWESPADEYAPEHNHVALCDEWGPTIPFSRRLRYKEQAADRFILGYAPDPHRPDAIDRLQAGAEIYGVRVYGELKLRMMYDNWDALRLFRFCGEHGLPVTVHQDYESDTGRMYPRDCFDNRHQEFLDSLKLPGDVLSKIYAGNALRLAPDDRQ